MRKPRRSRPDPKHISLKAATTHALTQIDAWPGEFAIHEVMGLARAYLRWNGADGHKRVLAKTYHSPEWLGHIERLLREWVNVRLRKTYDEYHLRVYVCYRIKGQKRRHWLKLDNLTVKTLDYLTDDRDVLVDDIEALRPYLVRGREKMIENGPDTLFGDVKADVVSELEDKAS